MQIKYIDRNS